MPNEELGQLLSLIAHEIRAPLGVMRGYLRLLEQQDGLSDQHRRAVSAALKAGERASDILGQVSALARLHRGEVVPSLHGTPLESLLRSAGGAVTMPPEPVITIHVQQTPTVTIAADEELLRVAVAGLTSAVVRAQASDARVLLQPREEHRAGRAGIAVRIAITDTPGPAERAHPLNISRGGLALDLPIAAFIVAAHGGEVTERRDGDRLVGMELWVPLS